VPGGVGGGERPHKTHGNEVNGTGHLMTRSPIDLTFCFPPNGNWQIEFRVHS